MNNLFALTAREWKAFWYSPVAYAVGFFFLLLQGGTFWILVQALNDPRADPSWTVSQFYFQWIFYWIIMFVMPPMLTMRAFSEEKRTGTLEVLLSAPVTDWQVVLAKFLGAWLCFVALWALTLAHFLILWRYTALDWGGIAAGYLGTGLLGAVLIAFGVLASSFTRNQIIALFMSYAFVIGFFCIGVMDAFVTDPQTRQTIQYLSLIDHFQDFSKGIVDTRPIVFYLSITAIALFLTVRTIATPRWRT